MSKTGPTWALMLSLALLVTGCSQSLEQLRSEHVQEETQAWQARETKLEGALTLERAIDLALENNLGYHVAILQHEIRTEAVTAARLGMLPNLDARFDFTHRDRLRISSSESADSGRTSLEPSFASERDSSTFSLEAVWSVLDFGIAFFRARQAKNQALLSNQTLRRTRQNLALEVASAYFRSVVANQAVKATQTLIGKLKSRQQLIAQQIKKKTVSPLDGLEGEEQLAMLQIRLQAFVLDLRRAKMQLATQIGLSAQADFSLAPVNFSVAPARIALDVKALEQEALKQRPELFQGDLQELISRDQVYMQIATMLPSPSGFLGFHTDTNKFLRNQHWTTAGIRASWNLLAIPRRYKQVQQARQTRDLAKVQRLAVAVGVLTQTHLAVLRYEDARQQYELASNLASIRSRKMTETAKSRKQGQRSEGDVLQAEVEAFLARIRLMNAHAATQLAAARIANTVGRDPVGTAPVSEAQVEQESEEAEEAGESEK